MATADASPARLVIRALIDAAQAADLARLAALGVAYGADSRHDLEATAHAQAAAHAAGMSAVKLTSAAQDLEHRMGGQT